MKKKTRTLVLALSSLAVAVAALIAVSIFIKPQVPEDEDIVPDIVLVDKNRDALAKVTVKNQNDEYTISKKTAGEWRIDELADFDPYEYKYLFMANVLTNVYSSVKIDAPESLEPFGLTEPDATAEVLYSDGSTVTISIGSDTLSAQYAGKHFKISGDDAVYIMPLDRAELLLADRRQFISTTITDVGYENVLSAINYIKVSGTEVATPVHIVGEAENPDGITKPQTSETYVITRPILKRCDDVKIQHLIMQLSVLRTSSVYKINPTKEEIAECFLDNPSSEILLSFGQKEELWHFRLGAKTDNGAYYMMVNNVNLIYIVPATYVDAWAEATPMSFISNIIDAPFLDDLKAVTVFDGQQSTRFDVQGKLTEMTVKSGGKDIDARIFRLLYRDIMAFNTITQVLTVPSKKGKLLFAVTYEYKAENIPPYIVECFDIGDRDMQMFVNGQPCFLQNQSNLLDVLPKIPKALAGEDW